MKGKIAAWNATNLSLAGRTTLAQAVLSTMPLYAMQTSNIPLGTCDEMEKVIRGFVWGRRMEGHRLSKVAWHKVVRSKAEGGLGIRELRKVNLAFGMKACWRLLKKPNSLWGRVMCAKYKFNPGLGFDPCVTTPCTSFWRLVCQSWVEMRKHLVWALGAGNTVQFWNHRWIPNLMEPLSEVATQRIPDHLLFKTVDYFVGSLGWDWLKFQHLLPSEVVDLIVAIMPPDKSQGKDESYWGPSSSGAFSVKSAYVGLIGDSSRAVLPWRRVWSWYGPQRVKMFLWLLLHNGVLVNEERAKRGISSSGICSMCGSMSESSLHMLRDCNDAKRTWKGLMGYDEVESFFDVSLSLKEWIIRNISSKILMSSGVRWRTVFGIGCWQLWKKRCNFIFKGERVNPVGTISRIINMVKIVESARTMDNLDSAVAKLLVMISWRPPQLDILKLNTDASLKGGAGLAFGGGLIRDELGAWRAGFVANVGACSILTAEIWCLFHGIQLAKNLGIRKLVVESDSDVGVAMIMGRCEVTITCQTIVQRVRGLLQDFESVVVQHVHREGNFAADFLSHYAYSFQRGVHVLDGPPPGMNVWLLHDRLGVSYLR